MGRQLKSEASSLSPPEVRVLWEETGPKSGSVGILSLKGEEDVKKSEVALWPLEECPPGIRGPGNFHNAYQFPFLGAQCISLSDHVIFAIRGDDLIFPLLGWNS